jgi:hypothetical protein
VCSTLMNGDMITEKTNTMTDEEKIKLFDEIQQKLWNMVIYGNPLQSVMGSTLIRTLNIPGPNGEDPDEA